MRTCAVAWEADQRGAILRASCNCVHDVIPRRPHRDVSDLEWVAAWPSVSIHGLVAVHDVLAVRCEHLHRARSFFSALTASARDVGLHLEYLTHLDSSNAGLSAVHIHCYWPQ